jgi:DNA-binding GntR family transcriptional regulator
VTRSPAPSEKIAEHFRGQIQDGTLQAGEKLPTVREIADTWHVARQTAGRAIEALQNDGLVTTAGRAGTVVTDRRQVTSLTVALDGVVGASVTSVDVVEASLAVAAELGVQPGSPVLTVRLRLPKV